MCALGLAIVVKSEALQWRPPLELGPPSEVGLPLEVKAPLGVALMWLGKEEETLEGYFAAVAVRVGRAHVGWWEELGRSGIFSAVHRSAACVV